MDRDPEQAEFPRRVGWALALLACAGFASGTAQAEQTPADLGLAAGHAADLLLPDVDQLQDETLGRLIHGSGLAGHASRRGPEDGAVFGVDVGAALPLPSGGEESRPSVALGVRAGYQLADGLAFQARYDDLGFAPSLIANSQLMFATLGMRYTFPFIIPLPFVEAMVGPAFVNSNVPLGQGSGLEIVSLGVGFGLGASFLLSRHLSIDVGARDWLTPVAGNLLQVITLQAGLGLSVGGPPSR